MKGRTTIEEILGEQANTHPNDQTKVGITTIQE
jgi:hypothetical protein